MYKMEAELMSALSRIESKFDDFESRLVTIEKQNENLTKVFSTEEQNRSQMMKFFHARFNELSTQLQTGSSSAGFFGKSRGISPGPAASTALGLTDESKQKLLKIEKTLDDMSSKLVRQETSTNELASLQQNSHQIILALETKIDSANRKMSELNVKLDGSERNPSAFTTNDLTFLEQLVEQKFQELPKLLGSDELKELTPKILQLQTNLDVLLTGENEANALIDKVMPTVARLQKDVDGIAKQQEMNMKKLQEDYLIKLTEISEDCYSKASDAKAYGKDTFKLAESIMDKLCKESKLNTVNDRNRSSRVRSKANSSSDEDEKGSRDPSPESVVASGKTEHQLVKVLQGLDLIRKEIRRVDVTDLLESRLIPNIFTIRERLENFIHYGPPQLPQRGRGRGGYQQSFHYRGFYNNRHASNPIPGTKWTYDEHGNREQPSDEEEEHAVLKRARSRSRSSSRSRSRSREHSRKSKMRKESQSDDSDVEGEIQIMESQINKIAGAVEEIQDKMDSWLKYSKRTLLKSDENAESIKAKVTATNSDVASLKDELGKELLEMKDILEEMRVPNKVKNEIVDQQVSVLLHKVEETVHTKLCEFGSMIEGLSSDQSKQLQALAVDIKPIGEKLKRQEEKLKSLKKGVDAYGQTGLQMVTLEKNIEGVVKSILAHHEKTGASNELFQQIKDIQPKLDDLYIKIFPVLEDIKKSQRRSIEQDNLAKKEDHDHIQKILDIVEDIKEGDRKMALNSNAIHPTLPSDSTNLIQIFNALTELKNSITIKDQNSTKHLVDLKGKINEVIKNQKLLSKLYTLVEEIRKNFTSDAKTLSQMNTVLQSLKASTSAHESKFSMNVKELKEAVSDLKEPIEKSHNLISEVNSTQIEWFKEHKMLFVGKLKNEDSPQKKTLQDSTEEVTSKNIGKILGVTEKKLLDAAKEQKLLLNELKNHFFEKANVLNESVKSIECKINSVEASELTLSPSNIKKRRINTESQLYDTLILKFNEIEGKIVSANEEQYVKILEEFVKHNGVSSEILNSVEDMKQLTSSMPNALHDLVPKIDKIEKCVADIPNELGAQNAALEENLCANLESKIKDTIQTVLDEMHHKFETMESRLAVIKKYAKHGPSASDRASLPSTDLSIITPSTSGIITNHVGGEQIGELVRNELKLLCDSIPQITGRTLQDVKALVENLQSVVVPLIREIHAFDKQLTHDCAKGIVMEEQFEALADTILKPINEMKPVQDKVLGILQNEITNILGQNSADGGTGKRSLSHLTPTHLNRVETKLSSGQKDCLQLLRELKSSQDQIKQNLVLGIDSTQSASQDHSPAKNTELTKSLGDFLKKVQRAQGDILRRSDQSIEYQKSLNDIYNKIVPNLENLQRMLEERKGQNLESGSLPQLCTDLNQKISTLAALENRFSAPRSQSCGDLRELVQMCVTALDRLLKDKSVTNEETTSINNRDDSSEDANSRTSFQNMYQQFVVSGTGDDGTKTEKRTRQVSSRGHAADDSLMSAGDRKRPSASSSSQARASARLGSKRSRKVNYAENAASDAEDEDDVDEIIVMLSNDEYGDRSSPSEDEDVLSEKKFGRGKHKESFGTSPVSMNPRVQIGKAEIVCAEAVRDSDDSSSSRPNVGSSKLNRSDLSRMNVSQLVESTASTTESRQVQTVSLKSKSSPISSTSIVAIKKS